MQAIVRLYETVHQHVPDAVGLDFWTTAFVDGEASLTSLATTLLNSDEFTQRQSHQDKESLFRGFVRNALGGETDTTGHPDFAWKNEYLERDSSELAVTISEHPAVIEHIRPYVEAFLTRLGEPEPFAGSVYQIPSVKPNPAPVLPAAAAPDIVEAVIVDDDDPEEIEHTRTAKEAMPDRAPSEPIAPPAEPAPASSEELSVVEDNQRGTAAPLPPGADEPDASQIPTGEPLPRTDAPPLERDVPLEAEDEPIPYQVNANARQNPAQLAPPGASLPSAEPALTAGIGDAPPQDDGSSIQADTNNSLAGVSAPSETADPPSLDKDVSIGAKDEPIPFQANADTEQNTTPLEIPVESSSSTEPALTAGIDDEPPQDDGSRIQADIDNLLAGESTPPESAVAGEGLTPDEPSIADVQTGDDAATDIGHDERSDTPPAADKPNTQVVQWYNVSEPKVIAAKVGETIGLKREHTIPAIAYAGSEGPDDPASIIIDQDLGPLRVDGIEHINIIVRGESSLVLYAAHAKTITISGQGTFKLVLPDNAPADLTAVDASALEGNFLFSAKEGQPLHVLGASGDNEIALSGSQDNVVKTSSGNDVIRTGGGADEIHTGGGSDTVSAGGGDDVIFLGDGADTVEFTTATTSTLSLGNGNMAKLVDFNAAEGDKIAFPFMEKASAMAPEKQAAVQAAVDQFSPHASLYRVHKAAKEGGGLDDGQIGSFVHQNKTYVFIGNSSNTLIEMTEALQLPANSFVARGPLTEFSVDLIGGTTVTQDNLA
jgi:hypothetical protein